MKSVNTGGIQRYGFAILTTVLATLARLELDGTLGDRVPFGLYIISVVLTAMVAGTGPAILSLAGGIIAAAHWIVEPHDSWWVSLPADQLAMLVYALIGVVTVYLVHRSGTEALLLQQRAHENEQLSLRLQNADHRKDEFLALLAHELRNPLAPIRSGLSILERESELSAAGHEVRHVIRRQVDQLVRLVDDLFDVSRFLRGQLRVDSDPVDLRSVVDLAIHTVAPIVEQSQHDLSFLRPDEPIYVMGDDVRLTQVVSNLLTNAVRYTPRCGRIRVLMDVDGNEARIKVCDNGIGVAAETREQIFDLFTQANPSQTRDHGGLGLGLAIVRQILEIHHGNVTVASDGPGRGSCFTVTLPLAPADVVAELEESTATDNDSPGGAKDTKRIMIVDDNGDAAQTLATLLSFDGYATSIANDGHTALKSFERFDPDIVLLDIGMPGMDGYEVARRLRGRRDGQRSKIIAVTGWGQEEDRVLSQAAGIDHHFVKPVDIAGLLKLIGEIECEHDTALSDETRVS